MAFITCHEWIFSIIKPKQNTSQIYFHLSILHINNLQIINPFPASTACGGIYHLQSLICYPIRFITFTTIDKCLSQKAFTWISKLHFNNRSNRNRWNGFHNYTQCIVYKHFIRNLHAVNNLPEFCVCLMISSMRLYFV